MLSIEFSAPAAPTAASSRRSLPEAVAATGDARRKLVKVTDMGEIVAYDVLKTPGLVINEKLVSSGRIPTASTIAEWIRAARWADHPAGLPPAIDPRSRLQSRRSQSPMSATSSMHTGEAP